MVINVKKEFNTALVAAAGSGSRMNSGADENGVAKNKMFLPLMGKSVLAHTLLAFENCDEISAIVVVTRDYDIEAVNEIKNKYNIKKIVLITEGADTRQGSVLKGLEVLPGQTDFVLIHDGARCLIEEADIKKCLEAARKYGAAAPGVAVKDSIKKIDENGFIVCDVERKNLINIQTPQVFEAKEILSLHRKAKEKNFSATDDTALFSHYGKKVYITEGSYENLKITTAEDMILAQQILKNRREDLR